jgi:thiol-disulfide isomerase/thioredoxin
MKKMNMSFALVIFLIVTINSSIAQGNSNTAQKQNAIVRVIDFHGTHRCKTCLAIEKQTREALNKYFKKEMDAGTITFSVINVDKAENEKIAEEFEAFGTALFIDIRKNGKSEKVDLTGFAFMNVLSENGSFEKGFVDEMNKALNKL